MEMGLNKTKIREISKLKREPKWMLDFRLQSYEKFKDSDNPGFGPLLNLDFKNINYYKKVGNNVSSWSEVPENVKDVFDKIGLPDAEKKYLAGVGAQFESEVIYHNMLEELVKKNVIFCDTDTDDWRSLLHHRHKSINIILRGIISSR